VPPHPTNSASLSAAAISVNSVPSSKIDDLLGCWSYAGEEWRFVRAGKGIQVVRSLSKDVARLMPDYAERARVPEPLQYAPAESSYAFLAAGDVHALLFALTPQGTGKTAVLRVTVYSMQSPGERPRWTGNAGDAERCTSPSL